jgi:CrcB protein
MIQSALLIFVGGGSGCLLRYGISRWLTPFYNGAFPLATLIANLISCVMLSIFLYTIFPRSNQYGKELYWLFATGFCGGLSTFSTFSYETFELLNQGMWGAAALNVFLSILFGVGLIFIIYSKLHS